MQLAAVARRAAPSLLRQAQGAGTAASSQLRNYAAAGPARPEKEEEDEELFELLPPGCSLKDPTYGRSFGANRSSLSDPVLIYDQKPVEDYQPIKKRQPVPQPPRSMAAAQAKLQESKDAKKAAAEEAGKDEDEDFYVYLPPGSSMRDPLPSSLSDPLDHRRVYYRDPNPTLRKK